jgi:sugar phosphate isomerase/epimerase
MNKLGMYTPEIKRDTVERLFDAIKIYGFAEVQFDFLSVCSEQMPASIDKGLTDHIYQVASERGIAISAVNGTFNMIHPNKAMRLDGIKRFEQIAKACGSLHCNLISLCTGSRNTQNMWRGHDDNVTQEAWNDLIETSTELVAIADKYKVFLGVEPEASNVINTAEKARKFLDTMKSPWIKIIFDPANLFHVGQAVPENALPILEHAFDLLGKDIIVAHGKDVKKGPEIAFTSAGRGIVAFERFLQLLKQSSYRGGIIIHGIHDEAEFPYSIAFMKELLKNQ